MYGAAAKPALAYVKARDAAIKAGTPFDPTSYSALARRQYTA